MRKTRMATHSTTAFDESEEVRILSGVLESKRRIKTFFKENDRTPNHDGNFEIINNDNTPKKQFIVQIKKIENLTPKRSGKNKGKYVYSLDTAFLYYVKEKVTESPAVYFVVDIVTKNIFWIYLSDEKLMSLDFENAGKLLPYAFSESDKLLDVDDFTNTLNRIAEERNAIFVNKTPKEIAEMQDAADYINKHMDNDFVKIKEWIFPHIWRFGIRHSHTSNFSVITGSQTLRPEDTALFSIYPQIKGTFDTGIQEYNGRKENYFSFFDLSGNTSPMEYSQDCVRKIIKRFFENGIPANYLPEIILMERISPSVRKISKIYDFNYENGKIKIVELLKAFWLIAEYTQDVLTGKLSAPCEIELKKSIIRGISQNRHNFYDMVDMCFSYSCRELFMNFCKNHDGVPGFSKILFPIIKLEDIQLFVILCELKDRKIEYFYHIWNYDFFELTRLDDTNFIDKINEICKACFDLLPELYVQTYNLLFDKNKYLFKGRFEYKNERFGDGKCGPWMTSIVRKYKADTFSVTYNAEVSEEFTDDDRENGLLSISNGLFVERILERKSLFFDCITCLLYNGVCDGLNIKRESLSINHNTLDLF